MTIHENEGISSGSRSRAWGLVNKTGSPIQGFAATEKVIPSSACGSPSLCHPELVSGSGLRETGTGGSG